MISANGYRWNGNVEIVVSSLNLGTTEDVLLRSEIVAFLVFRNSRHTYLKDCAKLACLVHTVSLISLSNLDRLLV